METWCIEDVRQQTDISRHTAMQRDGQVRNEIIFLVAMQGQT